jgi:hypothetical protein
MRDSSFINLYVQTTTMVYTLSYLRHTILHPLGQPVANLLKGILLDHLSNFGTHLISILIVTTVCVHTCTVCCQFNALSCWINVSSILVFVHNYNTLCYDLKCWEIPAPYTSPNNNPKTWYTSHILYSNQTVINTGIRTLLQHIVL